MNIYDVESMYDMSEFDDNVDNGGISMYGGDGEGDGDKDKPLYKKGGFWGIIGGGIILAGLIALIVYLTGGFDGSDSKNNSDTEKPKPPNPNPDNPVKPLSTDPPKQTKPKSNEGKQGNNILKDSKTLSETTNTIKKSALDVADPPESFEPELASSNKRNKYTRAATIINAVMYGQYLGGLTETVIKKKNYIKDIYELLDSDTYWTIVRSTPQMLPLMWLNEDAHISLLSMAYESSNTNKAGKRYAYLTKYREMIKTQKYIEELQTRLCYVLETNYFKTDSFLACVGSYNDTKMLSGICSTFMKNKILDEFSDDSESDDSKMKRFTKAIQGHIRNVFDFYKSDRLISGLWIDWKAWGQAARIILPAKNETILTPITYPKTNKYYEMYQAIILLSNITFNNIGLSLARNTLSQTVNINSDEKVEPKDYNGGKCFNINLEWEKNLYNWNFPEDMEPWDGVTLEPFGGVDKYDDSEKEILNKMLELDNPAPTPTPTNGGDNTGGSGNPPTTGGSGTPPNTESFKSISELTTTKIQLSDIVPEMKSDETKQLLVNSIRDNIKKNLDQLEFKETKSYNTFWKDYINNISATDDSLFMYDPPICDEKYPADFGANFLSTSPLSVVSESTWVNPTRNITSRFLEDGQKPYFQLQRFGAVCTTRMKCTFVHDVFKYLEGNGGNSSALAPYIWSYADMFTSVDLAVGRTSKSYNQPNTAAKGDFGDVSKVYFSSLASVLNDVLFKNKLDWSLYLPIDDIQSLSILNSKIDSWKITNYLQDAWVKTTDASAPGAAVSDSSLFEFTDNVPGMGQ